MVWDRQRVLRYPCFRHRSWFHKKENKRDGSTSAYRISANYQCGAHHDATMESGNIGAGNWTGVYILFVDDHSIICCAASPAFTIKTPPCSPSRNSPPPYDTKKRLKKTELPKDSRQKRRAFLFSEIRRKHTNRSSRAFSVWNAARFKPYGLSFRGKNAVFPLTLGRAALCRRLRVSPFSKLKRSTSRAFSVWKKLKEEESLCLLPP